MKKQIISIAAWLMLLCLSACTNDDSIVNYRLDQLEERVKKLEDICSKLNSDMSALQTIVNALQNNVTITEVQENANGYTIFFSNGRTIQINNGAKGKDGLDGKDGYTPVIGAALDEDGIYCWTVDGHWLLDAEGNRIHVTGDKGADGRDGVDGKDGVNGQNGISSIVGVKMYEDGRYYWTLNGEFLLDAEGKMIPATGERGKDGLDGEDGTSSVIGMALYSDHYYYWTINGEWLLDNLGSMVRVTGNDGKDGKDGTSSVIGIKQHTDGVYYWTLNGEWLLDDRGNKIKVAGTDGKDGSSSIIRIKKDTDGYYYWTLNGEWLLDADGNKIRVTGNDGKDGEDGENGKDGITPKLKIENDCWYVSYDNGITWTILGYAKGTDGKDGTSYVVTIKQDTDGYYYWTLNGNWMLDDNGQKVRVTGDNGKDGKDGITPQLKIEEDYWYISYDKGTTWTKLGYAKGADGTNGKNGDSIFKSVTQDENNVYFTLADGITVFTVPKSKFKSVVERIRSISYVPQYTDGIAKVSYTPGQKDGTVTLDYLVSPHGIVSEISNDWNKLLSLRASYAATRTVSFVNLTITQVVADATKGVLTITASCSALDYDFYAGLKNASVFLTITDTSSEISSDWAQISTFAEGSENQTIIDANGHEYVDLGLPSGLLWATCNVGAISSEDYGNYYAWGETETKQSYLEKNYKWIGFWYGEGSDEEEIGEGAFKGFFKYWTDKAKERDGYTVIYIDNKTILDLEDDAAHVNWGGSWRMPTGEEWAELQKECICKKTKNGFKVESKVNGNWIFLPATGEWIDEGDGYDPFLAHCGKVGYYWSSTLYLSWAKLNDMAECMQVLLSDDPEVMSGLYSDAALRYWGCSVRPVCHP